MGELAVLAGEVAARREVEDDPNLLARLGAVEARVAAAERRARKGMDLDAIAAELERVAEEVAADVVEAAEQRIRSSFAFDMAETRAASEFAAERLGREVRENVERSTRAAERELAQTVAEARASLERTISPSIGSAFLPGRSYPQGFEVAHLGGTWKCVASAGSRGEAPGPNAASWLLIADGTSEIAFRSDPGDPANLIAETTFASGRQVASVLPGVMPAYRGGFSAGHEYKRLELVHRDGALWMAVRDTRADPRHAADGGGWVLVAARGERGPGPSSTQLEVSERYLIGRLGEEGTNRDRVAAAVDEADDGWLVAQDRHGGTVERYARAAVGGAVAAVAGEAARGDGEALAQRVAFAALNAARDVERGGGEVAIVKARDAVRTAALTIASHGRPERLLDGLVSVPRSDRVLIAALSALVGR